MDKLDFCKQTEVYIKVNKNAFRVNELSKAWLMLTYFYIDRIRKIADSKK